MLQSSLTKHLLKADILFRGEFEIIPVDSGICRCRASDPLFRGCHQSGSLSGVTRERHPTSQSEHLLYAEKFFGIQRYTLLPSGDGKCVETTQGTNDGSNPSARGASWAAILQRFSPDNKSFDRPGTASMRHTSKASEGILSSLREMNDSPPAIMR